MNTWFLMIFLYFHSAFEQLIIKNDKICQKRWQKLFFHIQSDFWESGPFTNPGTSQIVTTIGWGQDSDSSSGISSVLREVDVPIMSNSDCDAVYGNVNDGHICIDSTGGKGTCSVSL